MAIFRGNYYITGADRRRSFLSRLLLTWRYTFYPQFLWHVWTHGRRAGKRPYSGDEWAEGSLRVMQALENVGVIVEISGLDHIRSLEGPAVFIGNHMSTLETFVLPCIIQPLKPVTFVVKSSLIDVPIFKHILLSRAPIVVGRTNPREDLKAVLEEGIVKLRAGMSIIIFPQSTRSLVFKPEEFNTLGEKLAIRANVPVVPFALKTDAWGIGKIVKEFGPIDNKKKVHFAFDKPMLMEGRGAAQHQRIIEFIQEKLELWKKENE